MFLVVAISLRDMLRAGRMDRAAEVYAESIVENYCFASRIAPFGIDGILFAGTFRWKLGVDDRGYDYPDVSMMASIIRCRAGANRGQTWISFSRRSSDSASVPAAVVAFVVAFGILRAEEADFCGRF
jgi:hypothetical protein